MSKPEKIATSEWRGEFFKRFPKVTREDQNDYLQQYLNGELNHVSIPLVHPHIAKVLQRACELALPDGVNFSEHGAKGHQVYTEVLQAIVDAQPDTLTMTTSERDLKIDGQLHANVPAVVVETRAIAHRTFLPTPQVRADELLEQGQKMKPGSKKWKQELKRMILDDQSVAGAILTALFMGASQQQIMGLFANKDFQKQLKKSRINYPKPGNDEVKRLIARAESSIHAPNTEQLRFNKTEYGEVIRFMKELKLLRNEHIDLVGFEEIITYPKALAVFMTAEEELVRMLVEEYGVSANTSIARDGFDGLVTTRLKTAYLFGV